MFEHQTYLNATWQQPFQPLVPIYCMQLVAEHIAPD